MQQCWNCGKVYDESEYAVCPYCNGRFHSHRNHKEMRKAFAEGMENESKRAVRFVSDEKEIV